MSKKCKQCRMPLDDCGCAEFELNKKIAWALNIALLIFTVVFSIIVVKRGY